MACSFTSETQVGMLCIWRRTRSDRHCRDSSIRGLAAYYCSSHGQTAGWGLLCYIWTPDLATVYGQCMYSFLSEPYIARWSAEMIYSLGPRGVQTRLSVQSELRTASSLLTCWANGWRYGTNHWYCTMYRLMMDRRSWNLPTANTASFRGGPSIYIQQQKKRVFVENKTIGSGMERKKKRKRKSVTTIQTAGLGDNGPARQLMPLSLRVSRDLTRKFFFLSSFGR